MGVVLGTLGRYALAAALGVGFASCAPVGAFECASDDECAGPGVAGYCEDVGMCSFPDSICPSARRYGEHAGDLAGECVPGSGVATSAGTEGDPELPGSESGGAEGGTGDDDDDDEDDDDDDDDDDADTEGGSGGEAGDCEWWDLGWSERITVAPAASVDGGPWPGMPVLVVLNPQRFDYDVAQAGGQDLRFVTPDGEVAPHEIERWNPDGSSQVWVRWPNLDGPDTALHLYYGNTDVSQTGDPSAVWVDDFALVAHLNGAAADATGVNPLSGSNAQIDPGYIGDATQLTSEAHVDAGSAEPLDNVFANGGTASAWIRPESWGLGGWGRIFDKSDGLGAHEGWFFAVTLHNSPHTLEMRRHREQGTMICRGPTDALVLGQWQWVVMVYDESAGDGGTPQFYVDSLPIETDCEGGGGLGIPDEDPDLWIGERSNFPGQQFQGAIDEARLATVARDDGWIRTQFLSMQDALLVYGAAEVPPPDCDGIDRG